MTITDHITASPLSRKEICERAGLSPSMLSLIEKGHRKASPELTRSLAQTLGVSPAVIRPDLADLFGVAPDAEGAAA